MDAKKYFSEGTKREKANKQEKTIAKSTGGKTTIGSGAFFQKGDVSIGKYNIRIEAKRTDGEQITLKKEWIDKLKSQSRFEVPVLALEVQDESWFVIRKQEFALILEYLELLRS